MAEFICDKVANSLTRVTNENSTTLECAVCLQTCIHPAELPCGHIFCYLCIKGIVNQGRRCAMCRQDIPIDFLDKQRLLKPVDTDTSNPGFEDGHLWFYEGHNGWWQYDERTSLELESAYQKGERCCELLIAGFLYIADFDAMIQYRRNDPWKRRRIKRDLATTTIKGVAGLKPMKDPNITSSVPDLVSNELIQSLPISAHFVRNNLSGLRFLSISDSGSSNSSPENNESNDETILRNRNLSIPLNCSNASPSNNINLDYQHGNDLFSNESIDLNSIIHDTLDWTIEQIESLNLELLNDYEVLFRDVNNYGNLSNMSRNRSSTTGNNYITRYINSRPNQTPDNELGSNDETQHLSRSHSSERNIIPQPTSSSLSSPDDVAPHSTQVTENITGISHPTPRTTGLSRLRSRINLQRRSTSLGRESLL